MACVSARAWCVCACVRTVCVDSVVWTVCVRACVRGRPAWGRVWNGVRGGGGKPSGEEAPSWYGERETEAINT